MMVTIINPDLLSVDVTPADESISVRYNGGDLCLRTQVPHCCGVQGGGGIFCSKNISQLTHTLCWGSWLSTSLPDNYVKRHTLYDALTGGLALYEPRAV